MAEEYYTVTEPVADLKKAPAESTLSYEKDDSLLSQLLFGERVVLKNESGGWVLVEAVEQQTFRVQGRWEGYEGWVRKESIRPHREDDRVGWIVKTRTAPILAGPSEASATLFEVSIGTGLPAGEMSAKNLRYCAVRLADEKTGWIGKDRLRAAGLGEATGPDRKSLLATALLFEGVPYLWGGRSMYMPGVKTIATGVDCSGLVNLVFRAHGIDVPRDAYEQWMKARPLKAGELQPCDLIFVARKGSAVSHVMLFMGGDAFIEAHETGADVRITTFMERLGLDIAGAAECDRVRLEDGREVSFGRLLP